MWKKPASAPDHSIESVVSAESGLREKVDSGRERQSTEVITVYPAVLSRIDPVITLYNPGGFEKDACFWIFDAAGKCRSGACGEAAVSSRNSLTIRFPLNGIQPGDYILLLRSGKHCSRFFIHVR